MDPVTIGCTLTVDVCDTRTIELSEEGREEEGTEVESIDGILVRVRLGSEGTSGARPADTEEKEVESTGKEDSTGKESKEANHKSEEGGTEDDIERT